MHRTLRFLQGTYTIHRLAPDAEVPTDIFKQNFYALARTSDELSLVCSADFPLVSPASSPGWCGVRFEGALDFSELGILASIARVLADAQVSIFAVSTYDTDYIFFKCERLDEAAQALQRAGYRIAE